MESVTQIRASELADRLKAANGPLLVDVRTPNEWQLCKIAGAIHLPLNQLAHRLEELDREREVVLYCHQGIRSQQAADFLAWQGFKHIYNLVGGIDAWSTEVDPSVARY